MATQYEYELFDGGDWVDTETLDRKLKKGDEVKGEYPYRVLKVEYSSTDSTRANASIEWIV